MPELNYLHDLVVIVTFAIIVVLIYSAAVLYRNKANAREQLLANDYEIIGRQKPLKIFLFAGLFIGITIANLLIFTLIAKNSHLAITVVFILVSLAISWDAFWPVRVLPLRIALVLFVSTIWAIFPYWWVLDSAAIVMCYGFLSRFPKVPVRLVSIGFLAVLLYDTWAVFGSKLMLDAIEAGVNLPNVLIIPGFGLLGLGDIVIPGIGVIAGIKYGTWKLSIIGWVVGLVGIVLLADTFHTGMPATVLLCPGVLIGLLTSAQARRDLFSPAASVLTESAHAAG